MAALERALYAYGSDNYGVLLHCTETSATASVDCGDAAAAEKALADKGWTLSHIWVTHHHADHVAGLQALKAATGARVIGPNRSQSPINGIDDVVGDGDSFEFAGRTVDVIHTPGHTLDMLNFHLPTEALLFSGDTLFTLGCGRLFEGDADMMWKSLCKLMSLPTETLVYGSHEYTLANAAFAVTVDGRNTALLEQIDAVQRLRDAGEPTVPSTIGMELTTNPFLRAGDVAIREGLGMLAASDAEVFAEVRRLKDNF